MAQTVEDQMAGVAAGRRRKGIGPRLNPGQRAEELRFHERRAAGRLGRSPIGQNIGMREFLSRDDFDPAIGAGSHETVLDRQVGPLGLHALLRERYRDRLNSDLHLPSHGR